MPRGPKPRPPRTNADEIRRNRDEKMKAAQERTVNLYPPDRSPPLPTDPTELAAFHRAEAERIKSLGLSRFKATVIRDVSELPEDIPAWFLAGSNLAGINPPQPPPPMPSLPPGASGPLVKLYERVKELRERLERPAHRLTRALTAEDIKLLASDDTCPAAMLAKALPQRPPWEAARPAWIDEAFRASIGLVNEKLCKSEPTEEALKGFQRFVQHDFEHFVQRDSNRHCDGDPTLEATVNYLKQSLESKAVVCYCCGVPTDALLERSARGLTAMVHHAASVDGLWHRIAPALIPEAYKDLFLRVVVPTFNAAVFDSRRCEDCGVVFALRKLEEVDESRRCEGCSARLYARESKRRQKHGSGDVETRARSRERGDEAIAAAERRQAQGSHWRQQEELDQLIDAQHKDERSTMKVKGPKKERKPSR